jgi:hypothetical protein
MLKREHQMYPWEHLTLEDLSLAFLVLEGKQDQPSIPPKLQILDRRDWEHLTSLLLGLMSERAMSTLH